MFGSGKKKADVFSHWYSLVPNFNSSTEEFYVGIERELKHRQVPGLEMSRAEFAEGGVLSDKRLYLRMLRERLVFDVCAAPFGTSYFFSCRFAEIPSVVKLWQIGILFVSAGIVFGIFWRLLGFWGGLLALAFLFMLAIYVMRNALAIGLKNLDAALLKIPVVGSIYLEWFRKETYYRQDTRLMYCDTVNEIVKAKVEEVAGANGVKLIRYNEHNPILGELYKPRNVTLPAPEPNA
jgi:hypothetical protein